MKLLFLHCEIFNTDTICSLKTLLFTTEHDTKSIRPHTLLQKPHISRKMWPNARNLALNQVTELFNSKSWMSCRYYSPSFPSPSCTHILSLFTLHQSVRNLSTKHQTCKGLCNESLSHNILSTKPEIWHFIAVFLNRRATARYRALASITPGREKFSWNLSLWFSKQFSWINVL